MNGNPWKTTIIIPCYKAAATLQRAAASALDGAPPDTELLLIDDGSPDDTGALCDALAAGDPRIRGAAPPQRRRRRGRNTGLDAAEGRWVLFLDADDELLPGLWEALARCDAGADMILFGLRRASAPRRDVAAPLPEGCYRGLAALGDALSPLLFETGLLAAPYPKLFRRAAIGPCGSRNASKSTRMSCLTYFFYKIRLPFIACVVYTISKTTLWGAGLSRRCEGDLLDAEETIRPAAGSPAAAGTAWTRPCGPAGCAPA